MRRNLGDFGQYASYEFINESEKVRRNWTEQNVAFSFACMQKMVCWTRNEPRSDDVPIFSEVEDRGNEVEQNREYKDKGNDVTHQ